MTRTVRSLEVDDDMRALVRVVVVLAEHDIVVIGQAGTGHEGIELRPDVVISDRRMPDTTKISMVARLRDAGESPNVINSTAHLSQQLREELQHSKPGATPW